MWVCREGENDRQNCVTLERRSAQLGCCGIPPQGGTHTTRAQYISRHRPLTEGRYHGRCPAQHLDTPPTTNTLATRATSRRLSASTPRRRPTTEVAAAADPLLYSPRAAAQRAPRRASARRAMAAWACAAATRGAPRLSSRRYGDETALVAQSRQVAISQVSCGCAALLLRATAVFGRAAQSPAHSYCGPIANGTEVHSECK